MVDGRPLAVDLCCGLGGWTAGLLAEGWRVVAFDIVRPRSFPAGAQLVVQDIATVSGTPWRGVVDLIVASPPCTEFSQIWRFARHRKPEPGKGVELVEHCWRIRREADCPMVLENVYGAQQFIGKASRHVGPYYRCRTVTSGRAYGTQTSTAGIGTIESRRTFAKPLIARTSPLRLRAPSPIS